MSPDQMIIIMTTTDDPVTKCPGVHFFMRCIIAGLNKTLLSMELAGITFDDYHIELALQSL